MKNRFLLKAPCLNGKYDGITTTTIFTLEWEVIFNANNYVGNTRTDEEQCVNYHNHWSCRLHALFSHFTRHSEVLNLIHILYLKIYMSFGQQLTKEMFTEVNTALPTFCKFSPIVKPFSPNICYPPCYPTNVTPFITKLMWPILLLNKCYYFC